MLTKYCFIITFGQTYTMANRNHYAKWLLQAPLGFVFTTIGIMLIMYAAIEKAKENEWMFWGFAAAMILNIGLVLLGSAFVHKVKADMIKRSHQKEKSHQHSLD